MDQPRQCEYHRSTQAESRAKEPAIVTIETSDGAQFQAYLAEPPGGRGPGVVVLQEIYGVNRVMRDVADGLASKGFLAIVPDLFWRQAPGVQLTGRSEADQARAFALYEGLDEAKAVEDAAAAMAFLRSHKGCTGRVGAVGFCLGGKLAYLLATRFDPDCAVGYYGVGIERALDESDRLSGPLMLHMAGNDAYCDAGARKQIRDRLAGRRNVRLHEYAEQGHAFARVGGQHYDATAAELANLRTLDLLRDQLVITPPDFYALWEEHVRYEFETRDTEATLETMVDDAYVNHIPTLTGGVGKDQLREFYSRRFIPQMPPDTAMTAVSRTIGVDRVVDEMIFKFTHTIEMDWMLPGVPPTGKYVEVPLVVIVHFREGKLAHEHIYWDQASVLVQLGLLDAEKFPVVGVDTARKVLDTALPSNALIQRADRRKASGGA